MKQIRSEVTTSGKTNIEKAATKDAKAADAKKVQPAKGAAAKPDDKKVEKKESLVANLANAISVQGVGNCTAEALRSRRKEFLIKKYSELCELLPCGIPGCNSTGRVSLW